jgi:hypothetical protein
MRFSKFVFARAVFGVLLTLGAVCVTTRSQAFASGIESVLFNFDAGGNGSTGSFPHSALIMDAQGNLYGTTENGGNNTPCCGAVFELSPPATAGGMWTETVLWNFSNNGTDGFEPEMWGPGLAVDSQGNLYGTTLAGGLYSQGTAWELSPPATAGGAWTETIIWNFGNPAVTDGIEPTSGLTIDKNGNLFGTTSAGQTPSGNFNGSVYELSPPAGMSGTWTETILKTFSDTGPGNPVLDGFQPFAGVIGDGSGDLFGTAAAGGSNYVDGPGGVLFEISAGGGYSVLWNFGGTYGPNNVDDGADPMSGLLMDKQGNIYGTTAEGGTTAEFTSGINGVGTVFELSPPGVGGGSWTESVLHNFSGGASDGEFPMSGVVTDPSGNLYGNTEYGGPFNAPPYHGGTVYKLTPPAMAGGSWGETILWDFGNGNDAAVPWGGMAMDPIGNLYGTSLDGGSFGEGANGTVYEIVNAPTTMTVTASIAFGNEPVGNTSTKNITIRNTGHANPLFVHVTSSDAEFAATGATTCPTGGLAPLGSCTIAIGFTPNALGAHSATLSIVDNTPTSPQSVALSGTGTVDMTVTPTSFMFTSTKIGSKKAKTITVHNFQSKSVSLTLPPGFSGANLADFSVTGGTCTSTLAAKTACTLIVTYAPTQAGTESATMTVTDSPDALGPYTVSFTTAENIPVTVTPATTLAFGTTTVAHPNKTKDITVANLSGSSLSVSEGSVSGANAGDFAVTGGTCGSSVAANSSCTIAITFTPTAGPSAESASIAVTIGSDPTSPHNIALTGTGP